MARVRDNQTFVESGTNVSDPRRAAGLIPAGGFSVHHSLKRSATPPPVICTYLHNIAVVEPLVEFSQDTAGGGFTAPHCAQRDSIWFTPRTAGVRAVWSGKVPLSAAALQDGIVAVEV